MTNFAIELRHALQDNAMSQRALVIALHDELGLPFSVNEVRAWLRGAPCAQWDRVLPALEGLFGIPAEQFVVGRQPTA